jgi:hypothetical protein
MWAVDGEIFAEKDAGTGRSVTRRAEELEEFRVRRIGAHFRINGEW